LEELLLVELRKTLDGLEVDAAGIAKSAELMAMVKSVTQERAEAMAQATQESK
jgi:hypothetical protein